MEYKCLNCKEDIKSICLYKIQEIILNDRAHNAGFMCKKCYNQMPLVEEMNIKRSNDHNHNDSDIPPHFLQF